MTRTGAFWVLAISIFCSTGSIMAGEDRPDQASFAQIEWFIGDWVGEFTANFDLGEVQKGDRVIYHASQRWLFDKRGLVHESSMEVDGRRIPNTHEVSAWNSEGKQFVVSIVSPDGTGTGVWTEVGDTLRVVWSRESALGRFGGTSVIRKLDNDSFVFQLIDVELAGVALPDEPVVTMRRKTGVPPEDLWEAHYEAFRGAWVMSGPVAFDNPTLGWSKDDPATYRFQWDAIDEGPVMIGQGEFVVVGKGPPVQVQRLCYSDPATGHVRVIACWANGVVEEGIVEAQTAHGFTGIYRTRAPGTIPFEARIRIDHEDADSFVIVFLDGPREGEVLGDWRRDNK